MGIFRPVVKMHFGHAYNIHSKKIRLDTMNTHVSTHAPGNDAFSPGLPASSYVPTQIHWAFGSNELPAKHAKRPESYIFVIFASFRGQL